KSPKNGG
ncbi:hypothetical protein VCHC67A1_02660B, partial [Vibrio cholerae HC-67A1]